MNIIIFAIILLVLVLVHEFGHFFSAKKFGIRVDEFGFGFPPKLFGKKFGETIYSINLLPIGGFVRIFGENPDEDSINGPDKDRSFVNKPKYQQAIVLFAGVFMNFLIAWLLFSVGFMSGFPTSVGSAPEGYIVEDSSLVVVSVLPDSPAYISGLESGDRIISVKSSNAELLSANPETFREFIITHNNQEVELSYQRGKNEALGTLNITPQSVDGELATIGISMDQIGVVKLPFFKALWQGLILDLNVLKNTALGLFALLVGAFTGNGSLSSVAGPVGLVGMVGNAYSFGFVYLLSFTALISVNLAIINLLPFPALDGGRLLFLLIEKIKGSRINPKIANNINAVGFLILIALMVAITYNDIVRLI